MDLTQAAQLNHHCTQEKSHLGLFHQERMLMLPLPEAHKHPFPALNELGSTETVRGPKVARKKGGTDRSG